MRNRIVDTFITDALVTEKSTMHELGHSRERLIHAAFGLQTETAEFTDQLKKALFYGKELDVVNLKEELGDILWYVALAMDELGTDFPTEMMRVVNKLKKRYGGSFSMTKALERDLPGERKTLEENDGTH